MVRISKVMWAVFWMGAALILAAVLAYRVMVWSIDRDLGKVGAQGSYVCCVGDFDLHVTKEADTIPISEPFDIQPALGYKVLLTTYDPQVVGLNN